MRLQTSELPSNRKFGLFFSFVFAIAATYFVFQQNIDLVIVLSVLAASLAVVSILKPDILSPANKLWMQFGLLLGLVVSPIALGLIYFGIFTPLSLLMRLVGRDELRLKVGDKRTHWIMRDRDVSVADGFKRQF